MNMSFILVQLIGVLAWIILMMSYHRKDVNKILAFQIISSILYSIHYYFLEAYSGLFICLFAIIIDYGYYKTNKDKYIFLASIPIFLLIGIYNYKSIIDILPIIASLINEYSLTKNKKTIVNCAIISYSLWVIYDISVSSYSGMITDGVLILTNLSILIKRNYINAKEHKGSK